MCGINGAFAYRGATIGDEEIIVCRDAMHSRGPDGEGLWSSADRRIALGHRRLSIIDLSPAGAQPMQRGSNVLVFNGEIYNYQEIRQRLEQQGRVFTSHSDTEVLLYLYAEKGAEMFSELRGMYALALWDAQRRRLLLARDPYGIKPLYYADDGSVFRFASQVRALVAGGRVSRQFDPAGAVGFFLRGTVPEPFTMYRGIRALPAGSYCWVTDEGAHEPVQHFSIAATLRNAVEADVHASADQQREAIHDAVLESVRYHMVADVPVGAFLSAGIDSAAVVAFARESGATDLQTMTLRFAEYRGRDNDEAPLATGLATKYGVPHTIREITREEFYSELPKIFTAMDQPSVDGLNNFFISKAAAGLGLKVALSGTGGDELFGGYTSFRDIPRWMPITSILSRFRALSEGVYRLNRTLARRSRHISPKMGEILRHGSSYAGAYLVKRGRFLVEELPDVLPADVAAEGLERLQILDVIEKTVSPDPGTPYARVAALESSLYLRNQLLRDMDWASMAHSLEVRVPLVDAHLLQRVAPVLVHRRGRGKGVLADAPRPPLPAAIRVRRKTGFTLPIREWLEKENAGRVESGKRSWARRVFEELFSAARGRW